MHALQSAAQHCRCWVSAQHKALLSLAKACKPFCLGLTQPQQRTLGACLSHQRQEGRRFFWMSCFPTALPE